MNEAILHELAQKLGGRFKLTALVQKRLIQLMQARHPIISQQSGGRPIHSVVNEVAVGKLQLVSPEDEPITPELEEPLLDHEPEIEYNAPPHPTRPPIQEQEPAAAAGRPEEESDEQEEEEEGEDEDEDEEEEQEDEDEEEDEEDEE
jgi:hypothetical protein